MLLVVAAGLLAGAVNPLAAHQASTWYGAKWTTGIVDGIDTDQRVEWRFVDNFPFGDGIRQRVKDGSYEWNNLAPDMLFNYVQEEPDYGILGWGNCPAPGQGHYQVDKVGWDAVPGDGIAQVEVCAINANSALLFHMRFEPGVGWYTGTGQTPDNQSDMWGMAAHEFGHAGGRTTGGDGAGHFQESSSLCPWFGETDFTLRHTMCPTQPEGRSMWRSLEEHDRDTFRDAY